MVMCKKIKLEKLKAMKDKRSEKENENESLYFAKGQEITLLRWTKELFMIVSGSAGMRLSSQSDLCPHNISQGDPSD